MAGQQVLGVILDRLSEVLPKVGPGTDVGKAVVECLRILGKVHQPGSVSPQGKANELQKASLQNAQNGQVLKMLQQQGAPSPGGAPGGGQPQMPPQAA